MNPAEMPAISESVDHVTVFLRMLGKAVWDKVVVEEPSISMISSESSKLSRLSDNGPNLLWCTDILC